MILILVIAVAMIVTSSKALFAIEKSQPVKAKCVFAHRPEQSIFYFVTVEFEDKNGVKQTKQIQIPMIAKMPEEGKEYTVYPNDDEDSDVIPSEIDTLACKIVMAVAVIFFVLYLVL